MTFQKQTSSSASRTDSTIDEHIKTSVDDDRLMSKTSKSWFNSGQMKKTKSENSSALIATEDAITTMTRTELDTVTLETTFRVITIAKGSPTTLLLP